MDIPSCQDVNFSDQLETEMNSDTPSLGLATTPMSPAVKLVSDKATPISKLNVYTSAVISLMLTLLFLFYFIFSVSNTYSLLIIILQMKHYVMMKLAKVFQAENYIVIYCKKCQNSVTHGNIYQDAAISKYLIVTIDYELCVGLNWA